MALNLFFGGVSMNPEKNIVNIWLNRQGFFTIADINAKNRVVDILAIKQKKGDIKVMHVEVSCSVSSQKITEAYRQDLMKKFTDPSVVRTLKESIRTYLGYDTDYERVLVTTADISLPGASVVSFDNVLYNVVLNLDTQNYREPVVRSLQLFKYVLLSNPEKTASILGSGGENKLLSSSAKETLATSLLQKKSILKALGKKRSEEVLVELLKHSTLKRPERLAKALEGVLTKRTATRFLNVLLKQKNIKTVVKEKIKKDQSLKQFYT